MKRNVRRTVDVALPVLGIGIIFGSVLFGSPNQLQFQVILLLVGVLILEAGVWGLTNAVLPNERRYPDLRQEVDHFIGLVRALNSAAVARDEGKEDDSRFRESLKEMRASLQRISEVAGKGEAVKAKELPAKEIPHASEMP